MTNNRLPPPFGPIYPLLGSGVAKYRKIANPTLEQRRAHGDAVGAAIRERQKAALQAYVLRVRRERTPETWMEMYEKAMRDKRRRLDPI